VEESGLLGPDRVEDGDVLVGLASSGLHSNGYSLVRKALLGDASHPLDGVPEGFTRPLGEELLEPCAIYAPLVLALAREGLVHSAAHITGGGLFENVPRALPKGLGAEIQRGTWTEHTIFALVQRASGANDDEMFATFNMGLGMVLVVPGDRAGEAMKRASDSGTPAAVVGLPVSGSGVCFTGSG
jgi:phosphoribosylformylglycinamidine cyclo-ligase